jgi:hypothetical protein
LFGHFLSSRGTTLLGIFAANSFEHGWPIDNELSMFGHVSKGLNDMVDEVDPNFVNGDGSIAELVGNPESTEHEN